MKHAVQKLSPATAVAGVALFVSLGGVAYGVAAGSITSREIKNSTVQSRDVKDGSLQGRDIANNSVQSRDVKDGALRGVDVNDRSIGGVDLADNSLGDRQIDETKLDIKRLGGVDVVRYVKNVQRVQTGTASNAATPKVAPPARCPKGKRLIGGGARVVAATPVPVALSANGPSGTHWEASAYATAPAGNWQLVSVAICG